MLKSYKDLVHTLINAPMTSGFVSNAAKLRIIDDYAKSLFGGKISIPNIIVAGTKGKGSTCAVIDSVLRTSGLRSCLFTSPHLVTPRERIKINGVPISEQQYVDLYAELRSNLKRFGLHNPPFFAIHTLMLGLLFKHKEADIGVIECGVGGRFDWTKVFDPTVAAVTHLEYDHVDTLGNTPYSISWHKFGIYTNKSLNLTVPQNGPFQIAIDQLTTESKLKINTIKPVWKYDTGLTGPCAQENTALGVAAAKCLLDSINVKKCDEKLGAANANIHGRFQIFKQDGVTWMFDGAHTTESIKYCRKWYDTLKHRSEDDVLLCSTTKKRDPNTLLRPLLEKKWKKVVYVKSYNNNVLKNSTEIENLNDALNFAKSVRPKSILITGSLHLVGDVMGELSCGPQ